MDVDQSENSDGGDPSDNECAKSDEELDDDEMNEEEDDAISEYSYVISDDDDDDDGGYNNSTIPPKVVEKNGNHLGEGASVLAVGAKRKGEKCFY